MTKKEDPIVALLQSAVDAVKSDKSQFIGLAIGAGLGYLAHNKLDENPQLRDGLIGANTGEMVARLLGGGKNEEE